MKRRSFAVYSWALLALLIAVILWGAYVRATGSGAGCGNHWPLCNGEVLPRSAESETRIELTHRATSGLALLGGVGLVWWAFRLFRPGSLARRAAVATLLLLLVEAAIGAGIVLFELVGDDDSAARAFLTAFHLVNTFLLLTAATVTCLAASGLPPLRRSFRKRPQLLVFLSLGAMLIVGASGAVTALGDTLLPKFGEFEAAERIAARQDHFLVQLRIYHPILALLAAGLTLMACWEVTSRGAGRRLYSLSTFVATLVLVQVLAGAVNVFLLAPVWLQIVHLLLADLLWVALVSLLLAAVAREPSAVRDRPAAACRHA